MINFTTDTNDIFKRELAFDKKRRVQILMKEFSNSDYDPMSDYNAMYGTFNESEFIMVFNENELG